MQCDQSKPSESRSVALGGAVGELPKACMKARALIPGTEVDPHRTVSSLRETTSGELSAKGRGRQEHAKFIIP